MDIPIPSLIIMNGPQGAGKSHCIDYIMYQNRKKFSYGLVFTNTFFDNNPFPYIDRKYIHPSYTEEALTKLMDIQEKHVGNIKKGQKINEAFVIFDDCLDDPDEFKSSALKRLTTQLRHYHITLVFSSQYPNLIPARMRSNAMVSIIFQTDTYISLKALWESYGQRYGNENEFKKFLIANLGDYKFVFINPRSMEKKLENVYKIMIAPKDIPKFQLNFKSK